MSTPEQNEEQRERERERVVTGLRDHGIIARTFDGILLSTEAAAKVLSMLEDLRKLEERGHV